MYTHMCVYIYIYIYYNIYIYIYIYLCIYDICKCEALWSHLGFVRQMRDGVLSSTS